MSKSVLLSIKPKYCEVIASGKKTIEVRKTRPKIDVPFKGYIYCTKDFYKAGDGYFQGKYCGKVIGEFVCDEIKEIRADNLVAIYFNNPTENTCLNDLEMRQYANGKNLFLWHISNLVIYDKPRELSEFYVWKKCNSCRTTGYESTACVYDENCEVPAVITRPPQSYCYVECQK